MENEILWITTGIKSKNCTAIFAHPINNCGVPYVLLKLLSVFDEFFFLNNQPDALIIPILFCYKTLNVSGIFSAHHQEFSGW
jgi:hypothetical protein